MAKAPKNPGDNDKFEFYEDKQGDHRWTRTAPNGKTVGASTQGYEKKSDCEANAKRNGWDGKKS